MMETPKGFVDGHNVTFFLRPRFQLLAPWRRRKLRNAMVFQNGLLLAKGGDYVLDRHILVFQTPPASRDHLQVKY